MLGRPIIGRRNKDHKWRDAPQLLTVAIEGPIDQLDKMFWNLQQFLQVAHNPELHPSAIAWAAIDYCKASASMEEWIWWAIHHRGKPHQERVRVHNLVQCKQWCRERVAWLPACIAIANTAKHGTYRDADTWPDGTAALVTTAEPAVAAQYDRLRGDPVHQLLFLRKHPGEVRWDYELRSADSASPVSAQRAFEANFDSWENALIELDRLA